MNPDITKRLYEAAKMAVSALTPYTLSGTLVKKTIVNLHEAITAYESDTSEQVKVTAEEFLTELK